MKYINTINNDFKNVPDLIIKEMNNCLIIYLESLANQDKINEYILKFINNDLNKLPIPNTKKIKNYKDLKTYLLTGFTIILTEKEEIAAETKENITRSIDSPNTEPTIFGPKDSLTENIQTNLGLIKRRIKTNDLKSINYNIGKQTNTLASLLFIKNIAKKELVKKVSNYLNNINVDGINDIGELKQHFDHKPFIFPSIKITERPDVISNALLNGKIVIIMDTSPYALILPSFLIDFINPIDDNYMSSININFVKILRFFCFFLSIFTPAIYIAITTFNQETIPENLLINFQTQRIGVPFPTFIETIITLIICEILRESDIRFPSSYGSSISILGALVLGEAAVSAGIVSPIMIIIVAITYISSLIFNDNEIINGIRHFRFASILIGSFWGLFGVGLSLIFLLTYLIDHEVFNTPYFYPLAPFDFSYLKESLIKLKNNRRSKYLSKNKYKGEL